MFSFRLPGLLLGCLLMQGATAMPVTSLTKTAQRDSCYTAAWVQLGITYRLTNDTADAAACFVHALQQDAAQPDALREIAHLYYDEKAYKLAAFYWERLLTLTPEDKYVKYMLGKAYIGAGEKKKGTALCDEAI
jgi:Tfp pilus assembly protein PilF